MATINPQKGTCISPLIPGHFQVSNVATPTVIGFDDSERVGGVIARSLAWAQIGSNVKNTCRNFKHLVGRKLKAQDLHEEPLGFFGWKKVEVWSLLLP